MSTMEGNSGVNISAGPSWNVNNENNNYYNTHHYNNYYNNYYSNYYNNYYNNNYNNYFYDFYFRYMSYDYAVNDYNPVIYPEYPNVRNYSNWRVAIATFHSVFDVTLPAILLTLGIITNFTSLVVLVCRGFHDNNCTPGLISMATADFLFCLLGACFAISKTSRHSLGHFFVLSTKKENMSGLRTFVHAPNQILIRFSEWVMTYTAFERMVSLTFFPFREKVLFIPRRSYVTLAVLFLLTLLSHCHLLFSVEFLYLPSNWAGHIDGWVIDSIVSKKIAYMMFFIHERVFDPLCVLLVFVLTVMILTRINVWKKYKVKKQKPDDKNGSRKGSVTGVGNSETEICEANPNSKSRRLDVKEEMHLVRMTVALCVVFLVCYFPIFFMYYLRVFFGGIMPTAPPKYASFIFDLYYEVQALLIPALKIVFASCKGVIYLAMVPAYRKEVIGWCCRRLKP